MIVDFIFSDITSLALWNIQQYKSSRIREVMVKFFGTWNFFGKTVEVKKRKTEFEGYNNNKLCSKYHCQLTLQSSS